MAPGSFPPCPASMTNVKRSVPAGAAEAYKNWVSPTYAKRNKKRSFIVFIVFFSSILL